MPSSKEAAAILRIVEKLAQDRKREAISLLAGRRGTEDSEEPPLSSREKVGE